MIGKVIQEKRKEAGLTQAQLAERLGVTAPAVNRWEKDLSYPDASLLAPLARLLKTDLNSLFSFYDALSDKERDLIVDRARVMLMTDGDEETFKYIEGELHQNLSDGLLYKEIAGMLFGIHVFRKAADPMIYLDKIAEYYERALELLPEDEEDISHTLVTIYSELGDADKAEEAWSHLKEAAYDKTWAHAEMLYALRDYKAAVPEFKEAVLRKVIDLSTSLGALRDALFLNGEKELSEYAEDTAFRLRKLFDIWEGFDSMSRISGAIAVSDADSEHEQLMEFINRSVKGEKISKSPLFSDVDLGGNSREESTAADLMADILRALQKNNQEKK